MVLWWCTVKFVNKGKHCLNHERLLCQDVVCTSIIVIGKLDFGYTLYSPFLSEGVYQNLSTNVSACVELVTFSHWEKNILEVYVPNYAF